MSIATGTKLGQYEVQEFLGQGAMGVVYRAYHSQLERIGAIKVMQAMTPDADTVVRFRHEAQAIAKLRHPNIVDVYDFGEFEGAPYMIVEYVSGGSLANRMAHGRLDRTTALRYLRGIAAGLDYAHAHGVIHRDVKPANVLLSAEDTPVLADFGLAKLLQGSSLKSMTGVTTGTPAYMAPEQVAGHQVGPESDRYSLATIAYEMLTGVIPFDGEALMELLYAQVHRQPMPPSARYPDLGPAVDEVIMRGLAKDPAARWESSTAFVNALETALASPAPAAAMARTVAIAPPLASTVPIVKAAPAIRAPRAQRTEVMPVPAVVAPTAPLAAPAPEHRSRRRWVAGAAGLLVLLLLLGMCAIISQATTLNVNPNVAARGDFVRVTAAHVPANQAGEIQMWSIVHTFPFRANANGDVDIEITVPRDVNLGDHVLKICWTNTCHQQTTLKVVSGVAEVLPTPAGNQTPGASPSYSPTPTPGSTSQPTSTPTSRPTSYPTSHPTSTPTYAPPPSPTPTKPPPPPPSPTPTLNPCPPESPVLTAPPATMAASTVITVSGQGFTPNKTVTVTLTGAVTGTKSAPVASNGVFSVQFSVPLLATGSATATATDTCGRQASKTFTILVGL